MKVFTISFILLFSLSVSAEQLRYIDDSGNMHFVDSISQVPKRYLSQVVPPTPVPVIDANSVRQVEAERREYEQQQRLRQQRLHQANQQQNVEAHRLKVQEDLKRRILEDKAHLERAR